MTRILILLVMTVVASVRPEGVRPGRLAFTNVTVIDLTGGRPKEGVTVLIADGRIAAVGRNVRAPGGTEVVDATGKFLIPGLWDMHVHSLYAGRPELFFPMFLANGVTGVREMASTLPLEQIRPLRRRIERGEALGPRFGAVAGKILESPVAQLGPEFEPVASAEEGRRIVRSRKQNGADFVKTYNQLPRDVYFAIAHEARRLRIPFAGHVPLLVSAREASDSGQRSIEHLTQVLPACSTRETDISEELVAAGKGLVAGRIAGFRADAEAAESYDQNKALALFARFRKNGTWHCPTLVQRQKFVLSGEPRLVDDERLKYIPVAVREQWRRSLEGPMSELVPYVKRSFPRQLEIVKAMRAAGVMLLAGSDAGWGNPYTFAGFSLHDELALMVQAGLTPMEALQTATINPAKFLNLQDKLGTIERGKFADLVLLDANPLDDIANTRRIAAVVVNGRYLPRLRLQKMLADVEEAANRR